MRNLHRLAMLGLVTVFAVTACTGLAPMRTLKKLRDGLQARDESAVAAVVDFASVKRNVDARVEQRLSEANEGKLLGGIRAAVGERLAARVVEKLATPRGLINMACDGSLKMPPSPPPPCALKGELANSGSEGDARYSADLTLPDGKQLKLVLERQADKQWRVVDMLMSPESFEQLRKSIAD